MAQLKTEQYIPVKGLNRDSGRTTFSKEFLYNLINGRITHNNKSDLFTITNFKGNEFFYSREGICVGYCVIDKYLVLLVTERQTAAEPGAKDCIYRYDYIDGRIEEGTLLYRGDFGFSPTRAIETLGNYESDDIIKVYFADKPNPLRMINIVQEDYVTDIINYPNGYVSQFDFVPKLELNEYYQVKKYHTGGSFHSGTIQWVFTYLRKNGAESNIFLTTGINFISEEERAAGPDETVSCSFNLLIYGHELKHFDYVRVYAIERHDLNGTPTVRHINDFPTGATQAPISVTDTGAGAEVDINYLLTVGGEPISASTLDSKDGHLMVGDIAMLRSTLEELKDITILQNSEFIKSDYNCISERLETPDSQNALSPNSNVVYAYTPRSLSKDSITGHIRGFKTGEVYRFGIQAQHESGVWSEVLYLEDKECTLNIEEYITSTGNGTSINNIIYSAYITEEFKNALRDKGYKKVRICYVPLDKDDRRIVTQGIINSTLFNRKDFSNNSYGIYADYLTRVQPIIDNEFKFLFNDRHHYIFNGTFQKTMDKYSNPFSISFRFPDKYHGVVLQNTKATWETGIGANFIRKNGEYNQTSDDVVDGGGYAGPFTLFEINNSDFAVTNPMAINRAYYNLFSPEMYYDYYLNSKFDKESLKCEVVGITELSYSNTGISAVVGNKEKKESGTQAMDKWAGRYGGYNFVESSILGVSSNAIKPKFEYNLVYNSAFNENLNIGGGGFDATIYSSKLWSDKTFMDNDLLYKHQFRNLYFGRTYYFRSNRNVLPDSPANTYRLIYNISDNSIINDTTINPSIDNHTYSHNVQKFMADLVRDENADNLSNLQIKSNMLDYKVNNHLLFTFDATDIFNFPTRRSSETVSPDGYNNMKDYETAIFQSTKRSLPLTLWEVNYANDPSESIWSLPSYPYRSWLRQYAVSNFITRDYFVTNMFINLTSANPYINSMVTQRRKRMDNLFLADITRTVTNQYGGQVAVFNPGLPYTYKATAESLKENIFIPCGDAYPLGTSRILATDGDTYIQRFDFNKTQPQTVEYWQQFYESLSYIGTSYINLDGRYDKHRKAKTFIGLQKDNYGLVNMAYSQLNNFFTYRTMDYELTGSDDKPVSIAFSLQKYNQELVDKWMNINLSSLQDLEGKHGRLRKIINFNGTLYSFQDSGIAQIIFNPRVQVQTSDSVPIEITNSGKFEGFRYLTTEGGCVNKWSIKQSAGKLYYIDNLNKDLMALSGNGLENITLDKGFKTWGNKFFNNTKIFNPKTFDNFSINVDNSNGDLYLNWLPSEIIEGNIVTGANNNYDDIDKWVHNESFQGALLFNTEMGFFENELTYNNVAFMFNIQGDFYSIQNIDNEVKIYRQGTGREGYHFDEFYPTYIDYYMAPDYPLDKVFNSISYKHELYSINNNFIHNITFKDMYVKNNYQHALKIMSKNDFKLPYDMKKKFNTWGTVLPRERGNMNRIRSQWIRMRLKFDYPNCIMQLHELEMNYTI